MADFKYGDSAMPVNRVFKYGDVVGDKTQSIPAGSPEPTTGGPVEDPQSREQADQKYIDFVMDDFGPKYDFEMQWEKAKFFEERHQKVLKEYKDQADWKKEAARSPGMQTAYQWMPDIGGFKSFMSLAQDIMSQITGDESDEYKAELFDTRFHEQIGAASVAELQNKYKIKEYPGEKPGDFVFDKAVYEGFKQIQSSYDWTARSMRDFVVKELELGTATEKWVSDEAKAQMKIGDAYMDKLLDPTESYQDNVYLMGKLTKFINNFVAMGPQILGQVAAGGAAGFVGGALFMFPQIYGAKYRRVRELGGTIDEAITSALIDGALQGSLESLSMGFLLKGIPKAWIKNKYFRWVTNKVLSGSSEMLTEYVQSYIDEFTEAIGDPNFKEEFLAKDKAGRWAMIKERATRASAAGIDEGLVAGLWGMILGGGHADVHTQKRFNKEIDAIMKGKGEAVSEDILGRAKRVAKAEPIEVKRAVDAQDVLDNSIRIVEETKAEVETAQRIMGAIPEGRQIAPIPGVEPAPVEEIAPVEEAEIPEEELGLTDEQIALRETQPEAYQMLVDVARLQATERAAEKAKEPTAPKAKKAPVSKPESALSAVDKIDRLWNRLDDKQKAKVQDLYDNKIEPMPHIERYQMMQAALADQDLKLLERPTLTQWRNVPSVRPTEVQDKRIKGKVYKSIPVGRVGKLINRGIDIAYEVAYGEKAYQQELKLSESREIERKAEEKPVTPKKAEKAEERRPGKPQPRKRAKVARKLYDKFVARVTQPGKKGELQGIDPNKISYVEDLNETEELVSNVAEAMGKPIGFFRTTDETLDKSNAYHVEGGAIMLNSGKPESMMLSLFGHEGWHDIKENHLELSGVFSKVFWDSVNQSQFEEYRDTLALARYDAGLVELTKDEMKVEFEADFNATKWVDPVFLGKLLEALNKKNPGLAARLFDILNRILAKMKGIVQAEQFVYLRKDIEKVEDVLIQVYTAIQEKAKVAARISPASMDAIGIDMQASIDMKGPEAIKSPAVMYEGKIYEAVIHSLAWADIEQELGFMPEYNPGADGYTTTHGRFVDRDDGNDIAIAADQVSKTEERGYLISEDLIKDISNMYMLDGNKIVLTQKMVMAGDDMALALISAVAEGGRVIESWNAMGNNAIIESLGFKVVSEDENYTNFKYEGEIYEPNIIAGRFAAAWNKDLAADGRTAKLLDTISQQYAESARLSLDSKKQKQIEKELDGYLKRSWKSYADGEKVTASDSAILPTKNIRIKGGKSTMAMVQVSSLRGREETTSQGDSYFDLLYSERDGYERPTDFWEIPTWMAQGAKSFKNADTYIARNIEEAKAYLRRSGYESIMFSAMDANKQFIKELAGSFDGDIIVGGYVDPKYFEGIKNIKFAEDMEAAAKLLKVPYKKGVDYRQFKGTKVIPRLEMSKGCKHKCHFCTVPKKVIPNKDFMAEAKSFASLGFKLVYLNDKTFGQADNFESLVEVNKQIKAENPEFEGFIIQTTAPAFNKMSDDFLKKSGIKYAEIGMESYNDDILAKINKPHRTKHIDEAVEKMRRLNINFIPNVMVGLAGMEKGKLWTETADTYRNTITFLEENKDIISHTNTYILATYEGTETGTQLGTDNEVDGDENVVTKSWLQNRDMHEMFYRRLLEFSSNQLKAPDMQASVLMAKKEDPVILPQDLRETVIDDPAYGITDDPYAYIRHLHILDLKLRAYDAIPGDKLDSFAKHYRNEASEEFSVVADKTLGYMKKIYDTWLYRHESPETWFDSQFVENEYEESFIGPSEMFTARKIGWLKMGEVWEFDVSKDVENAVMEEHQPPEFPGESEDIVNILVEEYDQDRSDLQEESEENLWKILDFEYQMDHKYTVYQEMDLDAIAEELDANGWDSPVGETVRRVMIEKGYPAWRENFPSMDAAEERIRDQRKRMKDAKTDKETMTAISMAMNEQHVFGTMAEHMDIAKNELEELGNIAEGVYRFEDMLRRQYKPEPSIRASMELYPKQIEWAEGTKVVDDNGGPLIVYHTTDVADIDEFDIKISDFGSHFGTLNQTAFGKSLYPVILNIKNPIRLKDWGHFSPNAYLDQKAFVDAVGRKAADEIDEEEMSGKKPQTINSHARELLLKNGVDGVVYLNRREGIDYEDISKYDEVSDAEFKKKFPQAEDSWIAFKPEQIKSVWNVKPTESPSIMQSLDLKKALDGTDIKVKVAGKSYTINEQRSSIEKLLELTGGSSGLKKFLTDNGVEKTLAGRIQTIGKSMEEYPFPTAQETATSLLETDKKDPNAKRWYDNIKYLRAVFENDDDLNLFMGLAMLSHTSRNKGTLANMVEFIKFRMLHKAGQIDKETKFGLVDAKTVNRVLTAKNIDEMFRIDFTALKFKGGEVKVKAFAETFAAIMRDPKVRNSVETVVDIWVNRYFYPSASAGPLADEAKDKALSQVQHLRIQRHMREVEAIMTKKTKETWHPDMAQAVLWFHIRNIWEQARGKVGQEGYTFDETLNVMAERWSGITDLDERQVGAYIKFKLRDPSVRHILDTYSQDKDLNIFEMAKGDDPLLIQFFDAAKLPKDYDISGKTRHRAVIETDKIYNADLDPDGLIDPAFDPDDITTLMTFEKKLRDAGWVGLKSGEMTILLEPARVEPMRRGSLGISNIVAPEVLEVIKNNFPQHYRKLVRYQKWYDEGRTEDLDNAMRSEITRLFTHPLIDIRAIGPSEGRWSGAGREFSIDVDFDFANADIAKGILAEFLKDNAQYEGVFSEQMSGWNDKNRPSGVAGDQAPSVVLRFKDGLTESQLVELSNLLDNNGIYGSTYTPSINSLTLHHLKYRNNEKAVEPAIKYNDNIIRGAKNYEALYKKAGITFKQLREAGGEKGFFTNKGRFVNNVKAKELKAVFGTVKQNDSDFLQAALDSIQAIQRGFPSFEGFGQVWYNHSILSNDWKTNPKGQEYDKKIAKATKISRDLGLIAEPKIVSGEFRKGAKLFEEQGRPRLGAVERLNPNAIKGIKEFVKKEPVKGLIDVNQAALYQQWINAGINIGETRNKQLENFRAGKQAPVPGKQAALFAQVAMTREESYKASEAYAKAPNNLLGFSKDPFVQKGFYDQNYSFTARVEITYDKFEGLPGQTFTDEIRGLNKPHAMERARRNWDGARVQYLDGYKNNERKQKVFASITVYHGTGAEYANYDLSYLGSGEGFHAFGWGEYFTSSRKIAEGYARKLAQNGKLDYLWINLPDLLSLPGSVAGFQNNEIVKIYDNGEVVKPGFWKINVKDDGSLKSLIGPTSDNSVRAYARYKVIEFVQESIDNAIDDIISNGDNLTEQEVSNLLSEATYELTGFIEYASTRLGYGEKVIRLPEVGLVNNDILNAMSKEADAWGVAHLSTGGVEFGVTGATKIVHRVELSDDLKFADWYKTIDKKALDRILSETEKALVVNDIKIVKDFVFDSFKNRLLDNPTTPLFKNVYGELTALLGDKKSASMVVQAAGFDGIRYEKDSLYGGPPKKVIFEQDILKEELERVRPLLPKGFRDTHFVMSKLIDHDPEYFEVMKDIIDEELILNVHRAIEKTWGKNYVVFQKVEDINFVEIKEQIYLSLDAFRVQERGAVQYLNSKIGRSDTSLSEKLAETFGYFTGKGRDKSNWRYLTFDKLDPIRQWLGGEGHAYMKARGVPGAVGSLAAFLEHGKLYWDNTMTIQVQKDPMTKTVMRKAGFLPWLKKLGPNDGVKFFYWLIAKRAAALDVQGREHWLKQEDREKILAWVGLPENKEGLSWEQINDQFQEFNKNILDIATKAGVINKESRETWESDLYIPFYRVIENPVSAAEFWRTPPKSKDFLSGGIKRLLGGESKIGDPMENIMKNWTHLLNTSITNVARASAVKFANDNKVLTGLTRMVKENEFSVFNPVTGTTYDIFDTRKEAQEYVRDEITSNDLFKKKDIKIIKHTQEVEVPIPVVEEVPWSQTVVMKPQKDAEGKPTGAIYVHKKSGEQLLGYQKAGKMQYFKVNDPQLYISISGMNPHQFNNAVMTFFRTAKRWLTYGATFGPGFKIANTIRDTMHTSLISKSFFPFVDTMRGFWKAWGENEAYINYLASGHAFGGHYVKSEDPAVLAKYIKSTLKGQNIADKFINQLLGSEGKTIIGRILDTPGKLLNFWERIGAASENAARVQLAENLLAKGETTEKAYFASRDLMDFQMSGAAGIVQFLIQTIPFLNARGQGLYKMGRALAENPVSFAIKAFTIMLASLGLWLMYKDDDRYKELEDWDRFAYYHFWIGDYHYRIPKPFETGVLFSTSVEAAGNVLVGNEDLDHLWTYMKHATTETFAFNPILGIQAIKPLAEQWANKVSFTGRPIEGQGLSGLRWGERYDPWTSETMRLIGGTLNLPPKRMEHLVRGYTGTMGMFVLGMADAFTRNAFDFPERPDLSWNEFPGFARFIKKGEARNTKYMTRFYDHYNEMSKLVRTVNYYDKLGDFKAAQKLIRDNKAFYNLKKKFSSARKELSGINKDIRLVWLNSRMDGAEKKRRLEILYQRRNKIVRRVYDKYKKEN